MSSKNMDNTRSQPPATSINDPEVKIAPLPSGGVVQTKIVGKYKVEVIRDKCIGAASCVAIAPKVFALDEAKIAIILSQDGEDDDTKLLAAQSCPTAAIIITNLETGQQVWPL
jgi:ferredoxin